MPVTTTYPGIYIEELPSTSHTVTAAPTSVTVFVGYTNPFWKIGRNRDNPPFNQAVRLTGFSDYQAYFGGFFSSPWLPDYVGQAVAQFFQNGGSDAYVVALKAGNYFDPSKVPPKPQSAVAAAQATIVKGVNGFTFTALRPVGLAGPPQLGITMTVSLSNLVMVTSKDDTADVTIVYGSTVETYRRLLVTELVTTINAQSALVSVAVKGATPPAFTDLTPTSAPLAYATVPTAGWVIIDPTAFAPVFQTNAPLDKVPIFNLMALPGITDAAVLAQALAYCEGKRAFYIMDPPENSVADNLAGQVPGAPNPSLQIGTAVVPESINGAIYFPHLQTADPVTNAAATSPPSGFVAGVFAREDSNRGVWKSPAGLEATISGTQGVVPWGAMTDRQQGVLMPTGVNCIRTFPGVGSVVYGARTLASPNVAQEQWKYVAVRRMALFIEQSLYFSLGWAIFEPNAAPLWAALTQEVKAFMLGLFRQNAFAGTTADTAFRVTCDATTTSQADIDNGIVNIIVGFAPLKPAEFVIVQIAQLAGQSQT